MSNSGIPLVDKRRKVKVRMECTPQVGVDTWNREITVTTGSATNSAVFTCTGKLSPYCAVELILKLRKAVRQIRDEENLRLNQAVADMEKPL